MYKQVAQSALQNLQPSEMFRANLAMTQSKMSQPSNRGAEYVGRKVRPNVLKVLVPN